MHTTELELTNKAAYKLRSRWAPICIEAALVALVALAFSIYFLHPLSLHMCTHLNELGDSRLNAFIQAWDTHALLHHPARLFHTNMFFPARYTLAGSENLLGTQLLFAPAYLATGNPAWATNFVILASFFLCAATMYLLIRRMTGDPLAAAIAGFIYGFALPRVAQLNHMQLLSQQWIPLIILCLYSYLISKRISRLVAATGLLLLQILCSLYLGYLAVMITWCFFVAIVATRRHLITPAVRKRLISATLALAVLLLPVVAPYVHLLRQRVIDPRGQKANTISASANPIGSYLDVEGFPEHVYRNLLARYDSHEFAWEKRLFMGFLPMTMALVGIFALRWRKRGAMPTGTGGSAMGGINELQNSFVLGCLLTLVVAYVLSLGPYLRVHDQTTHIRLPFAFFARYVLGMGVFRVPTRFGFGVLFAVAALAGLGYARLTCALSRNNSSHFRLSRVALLVLAILVMTTEFRGTPVSIEPVMGPSDVKPEYRWLAQQTPGTVTLELPISRWGNSDIPDPFEQAGYIYASTFHWQPLINGYTGYWPTTSRQAFAMAWGMPAPDSVRGLANFGMKCVLVHESQLTEAERERWRSLAAETGLREAQRFPDGTIAYVVRPDARGR